MLKLYQSAATAGLDVAQYTLGENLQHGNLTLGMEYEAGFPWMIRAAAAGMAAAQARVSFFFRHGRACGVYGENYPVHPSTRMAKHGAQPVKAFTYATLSAGQGSPEGMSELGQCWERGIGCELNEQKADALFVQAIDLCFSPAMYDFGKICQKRGDRGNVVQYEQAMRWFKLADISGTRGYPSLRSSIRVWRRFVKLTLFKLKL
jgi:TPR repeat protein